MPYIGPPPSESPSSRETTPSEAGTPSAEAPSTQNQPDITLGTYPDPSTFLDPGTSLPMIQHPGQWPHLFDTGHDGETLPTHMGPVDNVVGYVHKIISR